MEKQEVLNSLQKLRQESNKRNFKQSVDLIINLKNLNLKKPEEQLDLFVETPNERGKKVKVCALVGPESQEEASDADGVILSDDFEKYKDKKAAKKVAKSYDFFVAQANMMGKVASTFGKILGPRNKMPNPKAGCVVPPKTNLKPLIERLHKTVRITVKKSPIVAVRLGDEGMSDEEIADNIMTIYENVERNLPLEKNNIKSVLLKLTMSKPVKIA